MRLELTTPGTTNRYSNQLSYFRHCLEKTFTKSAAESQAKKTTKRSFDKKITQQTVVIGGTVCRYPLISIRYRSDDRDCTGRNWGFVPFPAASGSFPPG